MGDALGHGMVFVLSVWDDHAVNMLWLDSTYKDASTPRVGRGTCSTSSGKPGKTIDTAQPFTIVTQFITSDSGDLAELKRIYVHNGVVYDNSQSTVSSIKGNSIITTFLHRPKDCPPYSIVYASMLSSMISLRNFVTVIQGYQCAFSNHGVVTIHH
ncbi:hypothetical protein HDV00_005503 [Rhizophlyctis rosea]|nr:hypothetical protein HDV00_005503 [Rhizophlyctis rosea]